jgi:hypothetical protein
MATGVRRGTDPRRASLIPAATPRTTRQHILFRP